MGVLLVFLQEALGHLRSATARPTHALRSTLRRFRRVYRMQRRFGFLYATYRPGLPYWELVIMARKVRNNDGGCSRCCCCCCWLCRNSNYF